MSLLDDLKAEGCKVTPATAWETHGAPGSFTPIGILNHWDAIRGWPGISLYRNSPRPELNGQPTYHVVVQKGGTVHLVSQRHVYGAGGGDTAVYDAMRTDQKTIPPAKVHKSMGGNQWFWAVCVNYWPDGTPLPHAQYDALVRVNAALCRRAGWNPLTRINDHDGWTTRKDDLSGRPPANWQLGRFRNDVKALLDQGDEEMVDRTTDLGPDPNLAAVYQRKLEQGVFTDHTKPGRILTPDQLAAFLEREATKVTQPAIASAIKKALAGGAVAGATAAQVIDEIVKRLS